MLPVRPRSPAFWNFFQVSNLADLAGSAFYLAVGSGLRRGGAVKKTCVDAVASALPAKARIRQTVYPGSTIIFPANGSAAAFQILRETCLRVISVAVRRESDHHFTGVADD